jgi:hypothetical protein
MSIRRPFFTGSIIMITVLYVVVISGRYVLGLVACAFVYLDSWVAQQIAQESETGNGFGLFPTIALSVLMCIVFSYSLVLLGELEIGLIAAAAIFLIFQASRVDGLVIKLISD